MKKKILATALVAFAAVGFTTPALSAGFSEKEAKLSAEEKETRLKDGSSVFYGDKRHGDTVRWNPFTGIITVTTVIRSHGHNENTVSTATYCAPKGTIIPFSPDGGCAMPMGPVQFTHTTNGNATLGRALAGAFASVIPIVTGSAAQKFFGTCNGNCGSPTFNVSAGSSSTAAGGHATGGNAAAAAVSNSAATTTNTGTGGGCPTGTCPPAGLAPGHTKNGVGN